MEKRALIRNKAYRDGIQDASKLYLNLMSSRSFLLRQLYNRTTKGKAEAVKAAGHLVHEKLWGPQAAASIEKGLALDGLFRAEIGIGQSARQLAQALSSVSALDCATKLPKRGRI
jgi:hypothetical protein